MTNYTPWTPDLPESARRKQPKTRRRERHLHRSVDLPERYWTLMDLAAQGTHLSRASWLRSVVRQALIQEGLLDGLEDPGI